jgi:hypothetical protein
MAGTVLGAGVRGGDAGQNGQAEPGRPRTRGLCFSAEVAMFS